jgi:hypothetical protein
MRALAITAVFLCVMAWQYRKNEPLLFVIIATLFADAAMMSSRWDNFTDRPEQVLALCWLICMLFAGVSFILSLRGKKRDKANLTKEAGDTLK